MSHEDRRRFALRLGVLVAAMLLVALVEFWIGSRESKKSGANLIYSVAIYGACLMAFLLSPWAERYATAAIASVLIVALGHSVIEFWPELMGREKYEMPKFDVYSAADLALAGGSMLALYAFRAAADGTARAAWVMALLDGITGIEDVEITMLIVASGSTSLSIGSDVFDILLTGMAAVAATRLALQARRQHAAARLP